MIPKIIHYCMFGGKEKPASVCKCIDTWRKYCPDFEIKEWNETNFDVNSTQYTAEAYRLGNFAFVSDVARLKALTEEGGIYFDTDVEVIKDFSPLLVNRAFLCFEGTQHIATSTMGCEPHHMLFEEFLDLYSEEELLNADSTMNTDTNVLRLTKLLQKYGLSLTGMQQEIADVTIYPCDFFSPYDYVDGRLRKTVNTYSIHWYSQSWLKISSFRRFISQMFHRLTGTKLK